MRAVRRLLQCPAPLISSCLIMFLSLSGGHCRQFEGQRWPNSGPKSAALAGQRASWLSSLAKGSERLWHLDDMLRHGFKAPVVASRRFRSMEDCVGETPLVRLQRMGPKGSVVLCKLEGNNPAGSVKDRAALSMIRRAEAAGGAEVEL